jgi:hypothetical protein
MTLLDSPDYDPARGRRIRNGIIGALVALLVIAILLYVYWDWPEEHRVNEFFAALEAKQYQKAYGIWNNDPQWQAHPENYANGYPFNRFMADWGPQGEYGAIQQYKILYATSFGNGVLMLVDVNGRKTGTTLDVSRKYHTIGFAPFALTPVKNALGFTSWQISYE